MEGRGGLEEGEEGKEVERGEWEGRERGGSWGNSALVGGIDAPAVGVYQLVLVSCPE